MTQPTLFDSFANREPIAANVDPVTSHLAAAEITRSGLRASQKRAVLNAVARFPNRTSAELAGATRLDRYLVARRLPDLRQDGFVEQGEIRICRVTGHKAVTWKACESGVTKVSALRSPAFTAG